MSYSRPGGLDPKRAQNFNPSNVAGFYELLKAVYDVYPNFLPQHIWNMDEKGLQLGGGRKRCKKFFHLRSNRSNFYQIRSDSLELVTIIECISPAGLAIPPAFILAEGPTPALPDLEAPIAAIGKSPNGWTDNEIGLNWFQETFVPFATAHKIDDSPILLLVDGHDSHETDELRTIAYAHNIFVLAFPSKCTHKLQPLDVSVFAQVQHKWSSHCDRRIYEGVRMDRYNVIPEYMQVRTACMTPELICTAFSCTGIYPFNPNVFTDADYAPAHSFSTTSHVPGSFPADVPSSSPLPSDASDLDSDSGDDESEDQSDSEAGATPLHPLHMDWDTDSDDDSGYEPPLSCVSSPSVSSRALPTTPSSYISLPSLLTPSMPPVPAEPSAPLACAMSTHSSGSPGKANTSNPDLSSHFTRSKNTPSSSALSISVALDNTLAPIPDSKEELSTEVARLRMTLGLMQKEAVLSDAKVEAAEKQVCLLNAKADAAEAHCTILKRELSDVKAELHSKKNKTRRAVKTSARYVAHETMKELHASQMQEKAMRTREAAEKEAQKAEEEATRMARIREETNTRIFTGAYSLNSYFLLQLIFSPLIEPLSSYKRKDDLVILAGALGLETSGTIGTLATLIKSHLLNNSDIQLDPRFSGLFLQNKRRRVDNSSSLRVDLDV